MASLITGIKVRSMMCMAPIPLPMDLSLLLIR